MTNPFDPPKPFSGGAPNTSLPNVSDAMASWFQPMQFLLLTKTVVGFQNFETTSPVNFRGVIQPMADKTLMVKPEGERDWSWMQLHSDPSLALNTDDVVIYSGTQYRVMALKDYTQYGYLEYHLVEDSTGAGPNIVEVP